MRHISAIDETAMELELRKSHLSEVSNAAMLIHEAKIIAACYKIRVLFDTEHLKNDDDYIAVIEDIWLKAFKDVESVLLEQAVFEFIISDKKGYLPKPGQIVEMIVKGCKDIERRRYYEKLERLERHRLFEEYGRRD